MHSAPSLDIVYSQTFEKSRVLNTLNNALWYKKNEYNARLPGEKRLFDFDELPHTEHFLSQLESEYEPTSYEEAKQRLYDQWQNFAKNWPEEFIKHYSLTFQKIYTIHLTKYGVGGSYNLPNIVILNTHVSDNDRLGTIVFHEMIHLTIEELIKKYAISHWYKERIVDLLYKKLFPHISFEQDLPQEAYAINEIFSSPYGNIESIIKRVADELPNIEHVGRTKI